MFEEFGIIGNVIILVVSLIILDRASALAIDNSVNLASATGFGKTTIGFILVAFSTSLPELFVAAFAVVQPENVGISIGNVLGSNIANITLVLGIAFLFLAIKFPHKKYFLTKIEEKELQNLHFGLLIATIIPLILFFTGSANRIVGIILFVIFLFDMYLLSKTRAIEVNSNVKKTGLKKFLTLSIIGIVGLILSAYTIVESASFIAVSFGLPQIIIGSTVVAFGTSVPELATSIASIRKGHPDLALGSVIGSAMINITLILGVTLIAAPVTVDVTEFSTLLFFSLLANTILAYFLQSRSVNWKQVVVLLFIYVLFLIVTLYSII